MRFKINFTVNGFDDYFIISGDHMPDIRSKVDKEIERRGLDKTKNNFWSELIVEEAGN